MIFNKLMTEMLNTKNISSFSISQFPFLQYSQWFSVTLLILLLFFTICGQQTSQITNSFVKTQQPNPNPPAGQNPPSPVQNPGEQKPATPSNPQSQQPSSTPTPA